MKTTKKDFETFKKEFLKWIDRFGLKEYDITFKRKSLGETEDEITSAHLNASVENKWAQAVLSTNICEGSTPKGHAKHEAIHLLLWRLAWLGKCRYPAPSDMLEEEEGLVRILEKILQ